MHPEIKQFWESSGTKIELRMYCEGTPQHQAFYYGLESGRPTTLLAYMYMNGKPRYDWNRKQLTEAEMLRIVRLKAFL